MERPQPTATHKGHSGSSGRGVVHELAAVNSGGEPVTVLLPRMDTAEELHGVGEPDPVEDVPLRPAVGSGEPINEDQVEADCWLI